MGASIELVTAAGLSRCRRTPHSIFRRLPEWLALLLSAILAAFKTAATQQGPFKLA